MYFLILIFFIFSLFTPQKVSAYNDFVTIVNPVRVSEYNINSNDSVKAEYQVIKEFNLPGTWLLNYDSILNDSLVKEFKSFNDNQELGILEEITPVLANDSGVKYDNSYSWHHPANIFLTGYKQSDRIKLIDKTFGKFKEVFGYYPKSVGAWWIDSYSLNYIYEKYGAVANLGLADQYSTDGYQVWGSYWSTPFYPSKIHAAIPASSLKNKIPVVTMQWAPRDPLNGYSNSLFSTQDYLQIGKNLNTSYFQKLVELYALKHKNNFGHVVVGLEADLAPNAYAGEFRNQIQVVKELDLNKKIQVINMQDFGKWYKNEYPNISPVQLIESEDLLGTNVKTFWYQSPKYRIGLRFDKNSKVMTLFDIRVYQNNYAEPYYFSPNKGTKLLINIPSVVDEFGSQHEWKFNLGNLIGEDYAGNNLKLLFENGAILISPNDIELTGVNEKIPGYIIKTGLMNIKSINNQISLKPIEENKYGQSGLVLKKLSPASTNLIKSKRVVLLSSLLLFGVLLSVNSIVKSKLPQYQKILLIICLSLSAFIFVNNWFQDNSQEYFVSQSELDALDNLRIQNKGKVLVYGNRCLGCEWHTPMEPATFENTKDYVSKITGKKIVYNTTVFQAKDQATARNEFNKTKTQYIYVVNYEKYQEIVPFSPGDLGIEKVYENANAQIWRKII